jgi:Mlc titration factor MtfA (ptsG expression regulator)
VPLFLAAAVALTVIAWLVAGPWIARRRNERLRTRPFPAAWREILAQRVPYARRLPAALRRQLEQHVQVFVANKDFIGCAGFEVTDEARVAIAAQACLLWLNRGGEAFPSLREILVYPGAFVVERIRPEPSGVLQEQRQVLSGESWARGQVVLSWADVLEGAAIDDDGRNVVIHEFAHQLDQEKGYANGAPALSRHQRRADWSRVLGAEFAALQYQALSGEPSLFSDYGATDPAEFFAVVSEVFFEQPQLLAARHPALHRELCSLYRIDPAHW